MQGVIRFILPLRTFAFRQVRAYTAPATDSQGMYGLARRTQIFVAPCFLKTLTKNKPRFRPCYCPELRASLTFDIKAALKVNHTPRAKFLLGS
jgi:hypothetical protein